MKTARTQPDARTRRAIMELLKHLPQDARSLADELGISAMAVRQHLYAMRNEKLVAYREQPRPIGRPAKIWRLTAAANRFFPDAHAELTVGLIDAMTTALGPGAIDKLLSVRAKQQIAAYRHRLPQGATLRRRLSALAKIRTEEGYMAEVQTSDRGSFLFIENHCPICAAATACTGLCACELQVFQAVLGKDVQIERTDHIIEGARRCVYRVAERETQHD